MRRKLLLIGLLLAGQQIAAAGDTPPTNSPLLHSLPANSAADAGFTHSNVTGSGLSGSPDRSDEAVSQQSAPERFEMAPTAGAVPAATLPAGTPPSGSAWPGPAAPPAASASGAPEAAQRPIRSPGTRPSSRPFGASAAIGSGTGQASHGPGSMAQLMTAGDMIGFCRDLGDGVQAITIINASQRWMAVYHIDSGGQIRLTSSRPLEADFTIQFNPSSPLPDEIRRLQGK